MSYAICYSYGTDNNHLFQKFNKLSHEIKPLPLLPTPLGSAGRHLGEEPLSEISKRCVERVK